MKAVVFDLDGTLIDSAPDLHAAAVAMLRDLGRPAITLDQAVSFIGNGLQRLVELCLDATGGRPDMTVQKHAQDLLLSYYNRGGGALTRIYPGAIDVLDTLQAAGLPMGICTNKPGAATQIVLGKLGLEPYFQAVVSADTLAQRKPDPAPLLHCLEQLGTPPEQAIMIGDSEVDAATARAAGVPFALSTQGYRKGPIEAMKTVFTFDDFADLQAYLKSG
ncbi:MAG: phosphoglycolate phosphatase [Pseudomonadota bacterium]